MRVKLSAACRIAPLAPRQALLLSACAACEGAAEQLVPRAVAGGPLRRATRRLHHALLEDEVGAVGEVEQAHSRRWWPAPVARVEASPRPAACAELRQSVSEVSHTRERCTGTLVVLLPLRMDKKEI